MPDEQSIESTAGRALRAATILGAQKGHLTLATAIFPNDKGRAHWLSQLRDELATRQVLLIEKRIQPEKDARILDTVTTALRETELPPGWTPALAVYGFHPHLPDASAAHDRSLPPPPLLARANLDRELFAKLCPYPLFLCLTTTDLVLFRRHAPDLNHWIAHHLDFSGPSLFQADPLRISGSQIEAYRAGHTYANSGEMAEAEKIFRAGLHANEAAYGSNHHASVQSRANLANVLRQQARFGEALILARKNTRILDSSHQQVEPGDFSLADALGMEASLLGVTDQLIEAEPILRRALEIAEATHGHAHVAIVSHLNDLASLLQSTNRLAESEVLKRRALAIDEEFLGINHPNIGISLNNLALLLIATKRTEEAERLLLRAVEILEKFSGENHPAVGSALNNLAQLLQDTGRYEEAERMMRRVLDIDESSLGEQHPKVARDLNNLAQILQASDRYAEAEPLMRRALDIDEAAYGADHTDVARDLNNLARLLQDTDRVTEAEPLSRRHLIILLTHTESNGREHPYLRFAVENYLSLLSMLPTAAIGEIPALATLGPKARWEEGKWLAWLHAFLEQAKERSEILGK